MLRWRSTNSCKWIGVDAQLASHGGSVHHVSLDARTNKCSPLSRPWVMLRSSCVLVRVPLALTNALATNPRLESVASVPGERALSLIASSIYPTQPLSTEPAGIAGDVSRRSIPTNACMAVCTLGARFPCMVKTGLSPCLMAARLPAQTASWSVSSCFSAAGLDYLDLHNPWADLWFGSICSRADALL